MSETVTLLVVDDDLIQRKAIRRALRQRELSNPVLTAEDGLEALAILRGEGQDPIERPYLILLDLNMPRMDGIEFLTELRQDPLHRSAIVFVLTTSREEEDRARAYDLNVAGYIVRSGSGAGLQHVVDLLESYWRVVELPTD